MALVPESGNPKSRILYVFFCSRNIGTSKLAFPEPKMLKFGVGNENKGYKSLIVPCQSKSIYWAYKLIERETLIQKKWKTRTTDQTSIKDYISINIRLLNIYISKTRFLYDKHNESVWAWNKIPKLKKLYQYYTCSLEPNSRLGYKNLLNLLMVRECDISHYI